MHCATRRIVVALFLPAVTCAVERWSIYEGRFADRRMSKDKWIWLHAYSYGAVGAVHGRSATAPCYAELIAGTSSLQTISRADFRLLFLGNHIPRHPHGA